MAVLRLASRRPTDSALGAIDRTGGPVCSSTGPACRAGLLLASMTVEDDAMELVCSAFSRTPPLSARLRGWHHMVRWRQAGRESRRPRPSGQARPLVAPWDPRNPVRESITDRMWVATQRDSFRLEREWHDDSGAPRASVTVSDGTTMWSPTAFGAFHARPADPAAFPARMLLDPSCWPATTGTRHGRISTTAGPSW
jgi:hypothetical protein